MTIKALIAEAKKQRRSRLGLIGYLRSEALVILGKIVPHRPFRWVWQARTAWLLYCRWNAPVSHECRMTLRQDWDYAGGLAEMLDEAGDGMLWPRDAIAEDRQYWED